MFRLFNGKFHDNFIGETEEQQIEYFINKLSKFYSKVTVLDRKQTFLLFIGFKRPSSRRPPTTLCTSYYIKLKLYRSSRQCTEIYQSCHVCSDDVSRRFILSKSETEFFSDKL